MTSILTKEENKKLWLSPGESSSFSIEEVYESVSKFIEFPGYEYDIGVGTDSQMTGTSFQFISVISVHRVGKGGLYYYHKFFEPRTKFPVGIQKMRMFHEVACSIEMAQEMKEKTGINPVIHIDASPPSKSKEFTSKFSEQLRGYVQGCGFICMLKPESYIAHAIADRHTKKRSRKRRGREQRKNHKN